MTIGELTTCPADAVVRIRVPRHANRMKKHPARLHFLHTVPDGHSLPVHLRLGGNTSPNHVRGREFVCTSASEIVACRDGSSRRILVLTPLTEEREPNACIRHAGGSEFRIAHL